MRKPTNLLHDQDVQALLITIIWCSTFMSTLVVFRKDLESTVAVICSFMTATGIIIIPGTFILICQDICRWRKHRKDL